jgi:hypothetical protein
MRKVERRMSKMRTVVHKKCIENVIFVHLNDKNISEMQKEIKSIARESNGSGKGNNLPFQSSKHLKTK